jgi:hypothetical protein
MSCGGNFTIGGLSFPINSNCIVTRCNSGGGETPCEHGFRIIHYTCLFFGVKKVLEVKIHILKKIKKEVGDAITNHMSVIEDNLGSSFETPRLFAVKGEDYVTNSSHTFLEIYSSSEEEYVSLFL